MKRIVLLISILSLIVLSCGCSGKTKEFELRNGIHFGDSTETVKQKEKLNLNGPNTDEEDSSHESMVSDESTIADIENAVVQYDFRDGKLYQMTYGFGEKTTDSKNVVIDRLTENYSNIEKTLNEKYGAPISNESGVNPGFHSNYYNQGEGIAQLRAMGIDAELVAEDERLFDCKDGSYVVISNSASYLCAEESTITMHYVSYLFVSKEEWDAGVNEIEQHQDSINSEL